MHSKSIMMTVATCSMLALTGCAHQGLGSADYKRSEARVVVSTVKAEVVSVRKVKLEGDKDNRVTNTVGSGIGAAAGLSIGRDTVTRIAGAALGGLAGYQIASMISSATSERPGIEVVVSIKEGKGAAKLVTVTQESDPNEVFAKGDTVFMSVDKKGVARISKAS